MPVLSPRFVAVSQSEGEDGELACHEHEWRKRKTQTSETAIGNSSARSHGSEESGGEHELGRRRRRCMKVEIIQARAEHDADEEHACIEWRAAR